MTTYTTAPYLAWARRLFGTIRYDLAMSGMPHVPRDLLGAPDDPDALDAPVRLRDAIARYNDVPRDEAAAALGTSHGIWLAYAALMKPGDEVLVETPGYEPFTRSAEGIGVRVNRFERKGPRYALDPDRVGPAITPKTRVVAISTLHNPSGARATDEQIRETARLCAARGVHLLVDEVYAPLDALTDGAGVFGGSARKLAPNVVAVGSLTKCYGLGNHRIGWILGPRDVIEHVEHVVTATCGHLPVGHASLGAHAFARIETFAARTRALVEGRRARVAAWMQTRPDLVWSTPESGIFGFATTTRAGELLPLLEAGARDHDVLVSAGTFFGVPNGFRLSWATLGGADLDEALVRLGNVLPPA
jgi:aspartate/methionine/tyrosine aminotransferase